MTKAKCQTCGAELRLRSARCPLCGAEPKRKPKPVADVDAYHGNVRELREQLKRLRKEGAEAV